MYNIDSRALRSQIGISIIPSGKTEENVEDRITYYFNIITDMLVGALNSKQKQIVHAIDEQFERFPDDDVLPFFSEILDYELRDIKKQFFFAGFDPRLKFKLVSRDIPRSNFKAWGIAMDLEATMVSMAESAELEGKSEEVIDAVNENPTIEQLSQLYDYK